jgi:FkbM family methyltransferase
MKQQFARLLKGTVRGLLAVYLFPIRTSTALFYYVKGVFFYSCTEHLYRAVRHINRRGKLSADSVIIDVGAADGGVALYFAKHYKNVVTHCIEPNSMMLPILRERTRGNKNIALKNIALGSAKGEITLHVTADSLASSLNEPNVEEVSKLVAAQQAKLEEREQIKVQMSTLDDEFKDISNVLLIKLDTQGTELDVLRGGCEVLKKTQFVLTEMNNHHLYKNTCQYHEVDQFLRSRSFKLVDIIVTYRTDDEVYEYDALYENQGMTAA